MLLTVVAPHAGGLPKIVHHAHVIGFVIHMVVTAVAQPEIVSKFMDKRAFSFFLPSKPGPQTHRDDKIRRTLDKCAVALNVVARITARRAETWSERVRKNHVMKDWCAGGRKFALVRLKFVPIIEKAAPSAAPRLSSCGTPFPPFISKAGICIRTCAERSAARINMQVDAGRTIYIAHGRVVENGDRIVEMAKVKQMIVSAACHIVRFNVDIFVPQFAP